MSEITWVSYDLNKVLDFIPVDAESILDCGCGRGVVGALARVYRSATRLVGVDIYLPYLNFCRRYKFYDEFYLLDLRKKLPFEDKEFDVVVCLETIEHLNRKDGATLLDELERVGKFVIVTTPTRFFTQDCYDKNPYQQHRSLWRVQDFKRRGYKVKGVGQNFVLFGKTVQHMSFFLSRFAYVFPRFSSIMLAYKRLKIR